MVEFFIVGGVGLVMGGDFGGGVKFLLEFECCSCSWVCVFILVVFLDLVIGVLGVWVGFCGLFNDSLFCFGLLIFVMGCFFCFFSDLLLLFDGDEFELVFKGVCMYCCWIWIWVFWEGCWCVVVEVFGLFVF